MALWEDTILPLLGQLADALNAWLSPMFGAELRLAPDLDEIPALAPRRESVWERVGKAEFLNLDEKRAAVGYGPLPNPPPAEPGEGASASERVGVPTPESHPSAPPPVVGRRDRLFADRGVGVSAEEQGIILARALKALDDDDIDRAEALLAELLAKGYPEFNPDQARVPAGDPSGAGGQWSGSGGLGGDLSGSGSDDSLSGGAGRSTDRSDGDDEFTLVPLADQSASKTPVDLLQLTDFSDPQRKHTRLSPERIAQFAAVVDKTDGLTDAEKVAFVTTFFLEGDTTHGGIKQATLDYYVDKGLVSGFPARVEDFTDADTVRFYKFYFDHVLHTVGGGSQLAAISDPTAAAAFFDVLFQDGRSGGARSLQRAVNGVLNGPPPVNPKTLGIDGPVPVDGKMGPATIEAYARIANIPKYRDQLLDRLATAREKHRQRMKNPEQLTYWRIGYLRTPRTSR